MRPPDQLRALACGSMPRSGEEAPPRLARRAASSRSRVRRVFLSPPRWFWPSYPASKLLSPPSPTFDRTAAAYRARLVEGGCTVMRPLEPTTVEASIHVVVIILEVMGMGKPPWANGVVALLGETPPPTERDIGRTSIRWTASPTIGYATPPLEPIGHRRHSKSPSICTS